MGDRPGARLLAGERGDAGPLPYAPQLDGLRAVAVAAVAWSHWMPAWQAGLPLGAGVHLFFVLSGYLITRILLGVAVRPHRGRALAHFYARRALRLFPAFYLTLALAAWADVPEVRASWPWHAAYLSNVWIARDANWHGVVSHLWSLAVEEQFYLLWPWAMVWTPAAWRPVVIATAVALGPLTRATGASYGLAEPFLALVPGGSADSLGLGAWLAVRGTDAGADGRLRMAGLAGLGGWLALRAGEAAGGGLPVPVMALRQTLQGLVFVAVVAAAARGMGGPMGRALSHPVARYLGRISYGLYLAHNFAPLMARALLDATGLGVVVPWDGAARLALLVGTTVAAASLSWHLVEAPIARLKGRLPYG